MAQATTQHGLNKPRRFLPVLVVFVLGAALTVLAAAVLDQEALKHDRVRLHEEAVMQMEAIETRIELFVEMLQRLQDQVARAPNLDLAGWDGLVRDLNLRGNYPGLSAVGFWSYQPPDAVADGPERWEAIGLSAPQHGGKRRQGSFKRAFHSTVLSTPTALRTEGSNDVFVPDNDLWAKFAWNIAVGPGAWPGGTVFDGRRGAIDRGFRISLAVFGPGRHSPTLIQERHAAARSQVGNTATNMVAENNWGNLLGILYGDFAMKQFVASTLGNRPRAVAFNITDTTSNWQRDRNVPFNLIYGEPASSTAAPYLTERMEMKHYGRRLVFDFRTTPDFAAHSLRHWPKLAALIGGCVTLLVTGLVFIQTRARVREEMDASQLRVTNERLQAALNDRERLNRDLHDTVIQSIYAVGLGLQSSRRILGKDPERVSGRLTELMAELNGVIGKLRDYIHAPLEPSPVTSLGEQLEAVLKPFRGESAARLSFEADIAPDARVSTMTAEHIASIVREAVSNSVQHAAAGDISVRVTARPDMLALEVKDDGAGFELDSARGAGSGLRNIHTRVRELNGTLQIESTPGCGTLVRIQIPGAETSIRQRA